MPALRELTDRIKGRRQAQQQAAEERKRSVAARVLPENLAQQVRARAEDAMRQERARIGEIDHAITALDARITTARQEVVAAALIVERPAAVHESVTTGERRELPQPAALVRGAAAITADQELRRLVRQREALRQERIGRLSAIGDLRRLLQAADAGNEVVLRRLAESMRERFAMIFPIDPPQPVDAAGLPLPLGTDPAALHGRGQLGTAQEVSA